MTTATLTIEELRELRELTRLASCEIEDTILAVRLAHAEGVLKHKIEYLEGCAMEKYMGD